MAQFQRRAESGLLIDLIRASRFAPKESLRHFAAPVKCDVRRFLRRGSRSNQQEGFPVSRGPNGGNNTDFDDFLHGKGWAIAREPSWPQSPDMYSKPVRSRSHVSDSAVALERLRGQVLSVERDDRAGAAFRIIDLLDVEFEINRADDAVAELLVDKGLQR